MKKRNQNGFTLVELLVVISIIALLMGILMPSLSRARELAKRGVCLSNNRQLMVGASTYMADYDGKFPHQYADIGKYPDNVWHYMAWNAFTDENHTDNWVRNLYNYTSDKKIFLCPAIKKEIPNDPFAPNEDNRISYSANGIVTHLGPMNLKRPSELVAFTDDVAIGNSAMVRPFFYKANTNKIKSDRAWTGWMRTNNGLLFADRPHNGGRVYGYLDGHSTWAKWEEVTSASFGLLIGPGLEDDHEPDASSSYTDSRRRGSLAPWFK